MVDGNEVIAPAQSRSGVTALWRMLDSFERYSVREEGGDEWVSRGGYGWLAFHIFDLSKINNITGEHGRHMELGDKRHARGTEIDIFHFGDELATPADGDPFSGVENYKAARQLAVDAINGDAGAKATLKTWIEAQRTEVQTLVLLSNVAQLICPKGSTDATGILPLGWFEKLFEEGKVVATDQVKEIDIGGGLTNDKLVFDMGTNSHYHITLDSSALTNSP